MRRSMRSERTEDRQRLRNRFWSYDVSTVSRVSCYERDGYNITLGTRSKP